MSTFTIYSGAGAWIGFQVLTGSGRGMVMQIPITAVQNSLPQSKIPIGISLITFSQYLGSATLVAFGETIFTNRLRAALAIYAPNENPDYILDIGATSLRQDVAADILEPVLRAFNKALTETYYLSAAAATAAFICSLGLGWGSVKKKKGQHLEVQGNGEAKV